MKVPDLAKVLTVNVVVILLGYLVYQDLTARNAYAGDLSFAPSTSYSILTHALILSGRGTVLISPPTLDWPQLLFLGLLALDLGFVARLLRRLRAAPPKQENGPQGDAGSKLLLTSV